MDNRYFIVISFFVLCGCQSSQSSQDSAAAASVVGAISGQNVDEEKLRKAAQEIRRDPEARQAVEAISRSMGGTGVQIQYCPVDGKRYSPSLKTCPEHSVELKPVEE